MSGSMETPIKTPQSSRNLSTENMLSTPLFVPPTPMLKELGYGTGVHIYRIERSPAIGKTRSPWVVKRLRGARNKDEVISSRLLAEANILKSLDHPNIVGYRGSKTLNDERVILAMETCDTSLGDLIEQRDELSAGPLEPPKILKVCIDICNALDYLHTKANLLHGDLKSYNVLIKNSFEQCKLCDFGVSLPLNSEGFVDLEKNPKARYVGTDIYSAPEVFYAPPQDISSKCDIFSFGLIIFECLTLRPPHYEHLEEGNISGMTIDDNDLSMMSNSSVLIQAKQLFNDSADSKENQLNTSAAVASKDTTLNESQAMSVKSTAATIGDDTIQDITGTTFNGTINHTLTDVSFESQNSTSNRPPMRDVSASFNSTFGSEADYSVLEKSNDQSLNESTETIAPWYGTRPRLPETHQFDEEYFIFCETFYVCTQGLPEERPDAGNLLICLKNAKTNI
ncbi:lymphokine-activated killer T-cell-originated protein kinase [Sitodiplosis mosellana]|uniref:lymphokine-activated killer T-cell-originated protein kinase n=1 Tax=Sitodiplosis mosellana TaxID=263140 RepID=UPI002444E840|nr:lymphokine-activated killer T-cell-originated protein kinase [Sitodiplosis mosellana]